MVYQEGKKALLFMMGLKRFNRINFYDDENKYFWTENKFNGNNVILVQLNFFLSPSTQ